jgi:hypothetical protein
MPPITRTTAPNPSATPLSFAAVWVLIRVMALDVVGAGEELAVALAEADAAPWA